MAEKRRVGITYTGIGGGTSSFTADSVDDAFGRLGRISGFNRNEGDELAERLAPAADQRKIRIESFARNSAVPEDPKAAYRQRFGDGARSMDVITGIEFDVSEGPLVIRVTKERVRVVARGEKSIDVKKIGDSLVVHERASTDDHSKVFVLSRKRVSGEAEPS